MTNEGGADGGKSSSTGHPIDPSPPWPLTPDAGPLRGTLPPGTANLDTPLIPGLHAPDPAFSQVKSQPPKRNYGKAVAALLAVLVMGFVGVGVLLMTSGDEQIADAEPLAPGGSETQNGSKQSIANSGAVPNALDSSEKNDSSVPFEVLFNDETSDSQFRNNSGGSTNSADIRQVSVIGPLDDGPGQVVIQLAGESPGVGVIIRVDTDNDGSPDLTAFQHTGTGVAGSFTVSDWSSGNEILERGGEWDERVTSNGEQRSGDGVTFVLSFTAGELSGDNLRFNVQAINEDRYYDYFPKRHRWQLVEFKPRS